MPTPRRLSTTAPSRQGTRALPYKNIAYYPGRTGSSAPTKECPVGRDPRVPPPPIHRTPCKKTCHCEASSQTGCGNPFSLHYTPCCVRADRGSLSFCGERKGGKNAVKTKVLKSFPRLRCRLRRFLSATRRRHSANFLPCFRIASASPSATRSALVLAWRDGGNLRVCRAAA